MSFCILEETTPIHAPPLVPIGYFGFETRIEIIWHRAKPNIGYPKKYYTNSYSERWSINQRSQIKHSILSWRIFVKWRTFLDQTKVNKAMRCQTNQNQPQQCFSTSKPKQMQNFWIKTQYQVQSIKPDIRDKTSGTLRWKRTAGRRNRPSLQLQEDERRFFYSHPPRYFTKTCILFFSHQNIFSL